ncbi:MAG: aminopeptidase [Hydrogenobacter sp.]|uniref:aminopeptidase n=1 Tax=Hydrogenobacter thermophilus TaxID=940 RepID=UPI0030FC9D89
MYEDHIYRLYRVNMDLREWESILLLTDDEKDYLVELLYEFLDVAKRITPKVRYLVYPSLKVHGTEPPEEVWRITFGDSAINMLKEANLLEKVLNKEPYSEHEVISILKNYANDVPHVVVAFPYYSTTHTFYRKVLTDSFRVRYASMPLFEPSMFEGPMNVNWEAVSRLSTDVADILTEAEWAVVRGAEGTNVEFSLNGRRAIADTGIFHKGGDFGNLPAGEGFVAPIETSAYGRLVITYGPNRKLERPISLKFKDGAVEEIEGFEPYRHTLEDIFKKYDQARFIAEFGIGTNPGAKRADNVLEAEKILGTIHIAIGDNHTFGGKNKVPFHTDYVVFQPEVIVGGKGWQKRLLEKGKICT